MSYTINLTNGNILATIADGTINSTATSLTLIGKNYAGYGTFLNDNLVHILENSSSSSAPTTPLTGQLRKRSKRLFQLNTSAETLSWPIRSMELKDLHVSLQPTYCQRRLVAVMVRSIHCNALSTCINRARSLVVRSLETYCFSA